MIAETATDAFYASKVGGFTAAMDLCRTIERALATKTAELAEARGECHRLRVDLAGVDAMLAQVRADRRDWIVRADSLAAELAESKKDAARYRVWRDELCSPTLLLNGSVKVSCTFDNWTSDGTPKSYAKCIDDQIDAAIAQGLKP